MLLDWCRWFFLFFYGVRPPLAMVCASITYFSCFLSLHPLVLDSFTYTPLVLSPFPPLLLPSLAIVRAFKKILNTYTRVCMHVHAVRVCLDVQMEKRWMDVWLAAGLIWTVWYCMWGNKTVWLFRCMISIIFRDLVSLQVSSVYPGATAVWDSFF